MTPASTAIPGMGIVVARCRELAGLTQSQLAKSSGVAQSAIANLERGARCLPLATMLRVAAVLGCTVDDLIPEKYLAGVAKQARGRQPTPA